MELLERDQVLVEMTHAADEADRGSGYIILVSGEAGIGKTAIVREFTNRYRKTARILWGACEALFTPRPLGPLYDIAQQTRGTLSELLNTQASRPTIFSAMFNELQQLTRSTIVVIEDIHWGDEATLDAIKFLGRRIHQLSSLLIITYRDDELGAQHPLRFVLGDLPSEYVVRIKLQRLSEAAVVKLAEQAQHSVTGLYDATGGNPFFVTEILAAREQGVPATVRDAVLARTARLSPKARAVLELASVIPGNAESWLLNEILTIDSNVLDEYAENGMLQIDGAVLSFKHELARLAINESLSSAKRQSLHIQVLDALMKHTEGEIPPSRLAHHARHAGDHAALSRFALEAAKEARALGAHQEAVSYFASALDNSEQLQVEEYANILEDFSYECYLTDWIDESIQSRLRALEIWRQLGRQDKEGSALRSLSRLSWFMGKRADAEAYAVQAVEILEKLPPSSDLGMAYSNCAHLAMLVDNASEATLWGQRAVQLAESLNDNEVVAHALNNIGTVLLNTGDTSGYAQLEESLQISLAHGFEEHAARAYANFASHFARYHTHAQLMRYVDEGLRYSIDHDLDAWYLCIMGWRARVRLEQGYWEEAARDASNVLDRPHLSVVFKIPASILLERVRLRRGDPYSEKILNETYALAVQTKELQYIVLTTTACAEAAWLKGELHQCVDRIRSALELALMHSNPWERGELSFWMWRAGMLAEPPTLIAAPYAYHIAGDWQAAADAWEQLGCPYERAIALADGDEAAQRTALEAFMQLGATPAAEMVRQKLRAKGARGVPRGPHPGTKNNPAGLTARQMEVLMLLAEGLPNSEIAARLSTTAKTVEHHVSAILAKLKVRSRAEAIVFVKEQDIISSSDTSNLKD